MKRYLLPLLMLLPTGAAAQFTSARALIPEADSRPIPGIPFDSLWTKEFKKRGEPGYLGVFEHRHVTWQSDLKAYRNLIQGRDLRVLPLSETRVLLEYDRDATRETRVYLMEWVKGNLHFFYLSTEPESKFTAHLRSAGIHPTDGVFDGDRQRLIGALRTWRFADSDLDLRLRRPSHEEMGLVWSYFEMENWVTQQTGFLDQTQQALDSLQRLGDLHLAHKFISNANYGMLAKLNSVLMSPYEYGRYGLYDFEKYIERASKLEDEIDKRLQHRMKWVGEKVEILERTPKADASRFSSRPYPGHGLRVNVVATRSDGVVLVNTHETKKPWELELLGDVPEGIQFGLRSMSFNETLKLRIPPHLAFGAEHGPVEVELDIIESMASKLERPPIDALLTVELGELEFTETPSGLRYRDLIPAEGDGPKRGNKLKIRMGSWNAAGDVLDPMEVHHVEFGSEELMAGVNEALSTLAVGGHRIVYLPKHLAEQTPKRAGMAQAVFLEVISRRE